jgi:1,2-diacylglycerol 3-beta-glucosyltransferase
MASTIFLLNVGLRTVFTFLIAAMIAIWLVFVLYQLFLIFCAILPRHSVTNITIFHRFHLIIPAHNEEMLLGEVLHRLKELDYDNELYNIVVIADNCSDATATIAKNCDVRCLERYNEDCKGKGYALAWALDTLLAERNDPLDAYVILDADSILSPNFLTEMNRLLNQGAKVIQARYIVLNTNDSWRTRLMSCALDLAHHAKPLGRRNIGLSDGLKGNGMCFLSEILRSVPWSGESITEDIDYALRLNERRIRIVYCPTATVSAQMPVDSKQAETQRERWEGGRYGIMKRALPILLKSISNNNLLLADRALDILIPPFAELFSLPIILLVILGGLKLIGYHLPNTNWLLFGISFVILLELVYLMAGLIIAKTPLRTALSLFQAPFYILWKFGLYARMIASGGVRTWNRTERQDFGSMAKK